MKEIMNLRKAREKHFSCDDGTIKAYMYDEDIHYLKDGKYREIDNTIIDKGTYFENRDNSFKVTFPKLGERALYRIDNDNYFFECALLDSKSDKIDMQANENSLHITNLLEHLDARYDIIGSKLKESLILKEYTNKDITFIIETDICLELQNNRILGKKGGTVLYRLETPFMVSNANEYSSGVTYELTKKFSYYELTLKLDHEWLKTAEYPVTIDPTVSGKNDNQVYDTFIFEGDTAVDRNNLNYLKIGVDESNKIYRTLLKFDLPAIGTGSQVISAQAGLITHPYDYKFVSNDAPQFMGEEKIVTHEITTSWTEETANWETMSNSYNPKIESTAQFFRCDRDINDQEKYTPRTNMVDITNLAKKWYSGYPNNGLMLKFLNETYNPNCKEYYMLSKNNEFSSQENDPKPFIIVNYRNQNGLLNYLTYSSLNFKNGTSHINLYNGNITNTFYLNSTLSGKFPVQLDIVYNTNDVVLGNYQNGWRLSLEEKLELETIDDKEYIKHLDSTSNISYFYKIEEEKDGTKEIHYKDEDGQNVEIWPIDGGYKMTDKTGNEKTFTFLNSEYLLTKITDVEKNIVTLEYDTNNKLVKVTDANNQEILITDTTFDTGHTKTTITKIGTKLTKISIQKKNGESLSVAKDTTLIEYNSNGLITKISDENGLGISYDYYDAKPYRVKSITEIGLNDTVGKSLTYEYGFNTTKVTDEKNHKYTYTFNNQGNTIGTTIMDASNLLKDSYGYSQKYVEAYGHNLNNKKVSQTSPIKFSNKTLAKLSSKEANSYLSFTGGQFTTEESRSSNESYKSNGSVTLYAENLEPGTNITISGYIRNSKPVTIDINYNNSIKTIPVDTILIRESEDFTRFIYTYSFSVLGDTLSATFTSDETFYIADCQIDKGEYATPFNLIDNPYFEEEVTHWQGNTDENGNPVSGEYERVTLPNGEHALKINSNPDTTVSMWYPFAYSGKKGDVYNLSFWYKNEGIFDEEGGMIGNQVNLQFWSTNELEGCGVLNSKLNIHDTEWQFFSESFVAESDYSDFNLNIMSINEANNLYITDIMLVKEMGQYNFVYDDEGNIISMTDLANNRNEMTYDKNNQLIGSFTPKGNHFAYEYDNIKTDRVLKGISPTGISNEIEYDTFGNPIRTVIDNTNPDNEIKDDKLYHIRLKGTKKYIDYNFETNELIFKECNCNHKTFLAKKLVLPEDGTYYRLEFLNRYLAFDGTKVTLQNGETDATLFILTKKNNGSYVITPKTKRTNNLAIMDGKLSSLEADDEDFNQQFYFEDIDTEKFIETKATYTEDGRFITSQTDTLGRTSLYDIDPSHGLLNSVTDPKGTVTSYTYDEKNQMKSVTNNDKTVTYDYDDQDQLSKIASGTKNYTFTYDEFLNAKETKINNQTLITNNYEEKNGNLISSTYGNNQSVSYTYDEFDRLKTKTTAEKTYTHHYNTNGQLSRISANLENYNYYYDFANRLCDYVLDETLNKFKVHFEYDTSGNITSKQTYLVSTPGMFSNDILHSSEMKYEYNKDDSIIKVTFDGGEQNYNYDYLGRLENKNISNNLQVEYKYYNRGEKTSLIVKSMKIEDDTFEYKYDELYNITDIYLNGELTNHYIYDAFNELIEDDNYIQNIKYKYSYDTEGNILSKKEYTLDTDILTKEDTFEYGNPNWEDQLTKFNDEVITYDEIGNLTQIGTTNLTWQNGRQLKSITDSSKNLTVNYTYNKDGIRTRKQTGDKYTSYYLEGTDIVLEKTGSNMLYYMRDDTGSLIGFKYNTDTYYYIKNLQEDIIGIKDANFNTIATYEYDAWGRILSVKDLNGTEITDQTHIAHINPFRYRSYYYDSETELYYLKSRYYNPVWGRFINVDKIIGTDNFKSYYNLFVYCSNNQTNNFDSEGKGATAAIAIGTSINPFVGLAIIGVSAVAYPLLVELTEQLVTDAAEAVDDFTHRPKEKKQKKDTDKNIYNVYALIDPTLDNRVMYIGRTKDIEATKRRHHNNINRRNFNLINIHPNISYKESRYWEQKEIEKYRTLNRNCPGANQINGINPKSKKYDYYMGIGDALAEETYVGGLEWCE